MKKIFLAAMLFASVQSFAGWTVITGDGNVKSEQRNFSSYTSLSSSSGFAVDISYGTSNTITVEADENLLPYIETKMTNGDLSIKPKNMVTLKSNNAIKVHVTMTTIKSLAQSGSGSITGDGNFSNDEQTGIAISGSGNINLSFAQFNSADIAMSGSGSVELKGNISNGLDISQSGSGHINCADAACENVTANVSGSGNIKINASKAITAHISGSGKIYYSGNPAISSKVSGSGSIEKI